MGCAFNVTLSRVNVPERGNGGLYVGQEVLVGGLLAHGAHQGEDLALLRLLPVGHATVAGRNLGVLARLGSERKKARIRF